MKRPRDDTQTGPMDLRVIDASMNLGSDVEVADLPRLREIWRLMALIHNHTQQLPTEYPGDGIDGQWRGQGKRHRLPHANYYALEFDFAPNVVLTEDHMMMIKACGDGMFVKDINWRLNMKVPTRIVIAMSVHSVIIPPPQPYPGMIYMMHSPFHEALRRRPAAPRKAPGWALPSFLGGGGQRPIKEEDDEESDA